MEHPYRRAAGITAVVLGILAGAWLLILLRTLVLVLIVAGVIAAAFDRPVTWIQSHARAPRWLAVTLAMLLTFAILTGVAVLAYQPLRYQSRSFREGIPAQAERLKQLPVVGPMLEDVDLEGATRRFLNDLPEELQANRELLLGVAETTATVIVVGGTTLVLALFILLKGPAMAVAASELILDEVRRERARRLARRVLEALSGYVLGNLLISLLAALVVVVSLTLMHVPFVPVLALLMFLIDLIPVVGATLGGIVVAAATFVLDPEPWKALVFLLTFAVYQQVENHTIYPFVMGRKVRLSAFGILLMTLAGAELAGIAGAVLAIPVGAAVNVVLRDVLEERRRKGGLRPPSQLEVVGHSTVSVTVEETGEAADEPLVDHRGRPLAAVPEDD